MFHDSYSSSNSGGKSPSSKNSDLAFMKLDIERLLMITEALWTMLKEKHGYDDLELLKRVSEIDMRDGRLDGKVAASESPTCPHCNRKSMKHRLLCIYCGKPVQTDLFQR